MTIRISSALILLMSALSCSTQTGNFTDEELTLIHKSDSIMRVLTIDSYEDSLVLRTPCTDLSAEALLSPDYEELCSLMVATVTHPSQDGVGIAGPQVGLSRRVIAVQRFDKVTINQDGKTDHPFEVYPNIRIIHTSDSLASGPEGCLSVPGRRADVLRSAEIVIEYADIQGLKSAASSTDRPCTCSFPSGNDIPTLKDTIRGFTAVIFQHETDHLDGVLYIDRL
jgi:peptide deformylase